MNITICYLKGFGNDYHDIDDRVGRIHDPYKTQLGPIGDFLGSTIQRNTAVIQVDFWEWKDNLAGHISKSFFHTMERLTAFKTVRLKIHNNAECLAYYNAELGEAACVELYAGLMSELRLTGTMLEPSLGPSSEVSEPQRLSSKLCIDGLQYIEFHPRDHVVKLALMPGGAKSAKANPEMASIE